jgi:RNA polymerase sigma factor (sigma-70 family)
MPCEQPTPLVKAPARVERFAALRLQYRLTAVERYKAAQQKNERRRCAPRGRREYARASTTQTTRDAFVPDGSPLIVWARSHLHCDRKAARRVLALAELGRVDDAASEARLYESHLTRGRRHDDTCRRSVSHALKRYNKGWREDFESWWDARPKSPRAIRVIDVSTYVSHVQPSRSLRRVAEHFQTLAQKRHLTLVWPDYVDLSLPVRERVEHVWRRLEAPQLCRGQMILRESLRNNDVLDAGTLHKVTSDSGLFEAAWLSIEKMVFHLIEGTMCRNTWLHGRKDELVQEARIAAYRAICRYKGQAKFSTFAYIIIENALTDFVRRELRWQRVLLSSTDSGQEQPEGRDTQDPASLIDGWSDLIDMLRAVPDHELLLLHAAGYKDAELEPARGRHIKTRRNRAKKRALNKMARSPIV